MQPITRSPRVVGTVLRGLLGLPRTVQRLLAGAPIVVDDQQLDPSWQFLRWVVKRSTARTPSAIDVESVRFSQQVMDVAGQGKPIFGARYRPLGIPRPDGSAIAGRLYTVDGTSPDRPLLLFFHGGGFVSGSLDSHDRLCAQLAAKAEVNVLAVDYRLAPEHPFPAGLDDCDIAYRFALEHSRALESDGRVAVGGDSAGANLAITVAHEHRNDRRPVGLLAFYPPVDPLADTRSRRLFGSEFFLTNEAISAMAALYLGGAPPSADPRAATPQMELHAMPPTYLVTAGFDPLRDEGEQFGRQLADAGVAVVSRREPDLTHGFASSLGVGPRPREAVSEAASGFRTLLAVSGQASRGPADTH